MPLTVVAVVGGNVENTGDATREAGGEGALVERYILDGVAVEGGEEAAQVVDVVEGHSVEEEQVLVGTTSTDIDAAGPLTATLHTGQQLDGLQHVGLAEDDGNELYLLDWHLDGGHLAHLRAGDAVGSDDHLVEIHGGLQA